jgi:hypothetical protein
MMMTETTKERKASLLEALSLEPKITAALELAGVPEATYRQWRHTDAEFAQAAMAAIDAATAAEAALQERRARQVSGIAPVPANPATSYTLTALAAQLRTLEHRVQQLEGAVAQAQGLLGMLRQIGQDARTLRALHLWAQRTVGQSRGPLPDAVQAVAVPPEEPTPDAA